MSTTERRRLNSQVGRLAKQAAELHQWLLHAAGRLGPLHQSLAALQGRKPDDWAGSARQIAQAAVYGSYCLPALVTQHSEPGRHAGAGPFLHPLLADFFSQLATVGVPSEYTNAAATDGSAAHGWTISNDEDGDLYERFLRRFDLHERGARGVFYTPRSVAKFVIDGVDRLLRLRANIPQGLADTGCGSGSASALSPVVVLDPAAGSGRFLTAVIRHVYETMSRAWRDEGKSDKQSRRQWQQYVPQHLLPRLYGFEWSLAAYIAAHANMTASLVATGYEVQPSDRIHVYLADALAPPRAIGDAIPLAGFADESRRVEWLKADPPFSVIVGNPPYANFSANMSPGARALVARYKQIDGRPLLERNPLQLERNINDDYVKFLACAEDLLAGSPAAALGFVVNRSLLESATLRGVRARLLSTFQQIQIVDLGGDAVGAAQNGVDHQDENVFATSQGVALLLAARSRPPSRRSERVRYVRLRGCQSEKLAVLDADRSTPLRYATVAAGRPDFRFMAARNVGQWRHFLPIDELFEVYAEGLKTGFDLGLIGFTEEEARQKLHDWRRVATQAQRLRERYTVGNRGWAHRLLAQLRETAAAADASTQIIRFAYRPLDFRYCPWPSGLLKSPSTVAGRHLADGQNLCLIAARQIAGPADVSHFYVARAVPDNRLLYSRRGSATYFPLYSAGDSTSGNRRALLNEETMERFAHRLGLQWIDDGPGDLVATLGPESFLHYAYAMFHAPAYRTDYNDALRTGFPRIPPARDRGQFIELCGLGADLVALHLVEADYPAASWNRESQNGANPWQSAPMEFSGGRQPTVDRGFPKYADGQVWINRDQAIGPVAEDVWHFRIGGYRMAHKWLRDRRGRTLTPCESADYLSLLHIHARTLRLMRQLNTIIQTKRRNNSPPTTLDS